jgi:hypothetical protein
MIGRLSAADAGKAPEAKPGKGSRLGIRGRDFEGSELVKSAPRPTRFHLFEDWMPAARFVRPFGRQNAFRLRGLERETVMAVTIRSASGHGLRALQGRD